MFSPSTVMGSTSVTHRFFIGGVLTACKRYWFVTDEVAGDEVEDTAEDEAGKVEDETMLP